MHNRYVLLTSLLMASACNLAPPLDYAIQPPPAEYPDSPAYDRDLKQSETGQNAPTLSELSWQAFFSDPALHQLIRLGLKHNRSLKQAALDISAARAQYGIERSALFPQFGADGSYNRQDFPGGAGGQPAGNINQAAMFGAGGGGGPSDFYSASLGISQFEIDLFGRIRNLSEAALNQYFATEAAKDTVRIMLIADIATAYSLLQADRLLLELSERTASEQEEAASLIEQRVSAGIGTALELRQAEILLQQARADVAARKRQVAQDINGLRLLIGTPERFSLPEAASFSQLKEIAKPAPVGLPSSLLLSRPDIRQAEYQLIAANANIGAARAAFFPSISLTGALGFFSGEFSNLFGRDTRFWQFGPQINVPIFTAGRLAGNLDLAEIRTEQAVVSYEQTIETAFREVADALVAVSTFDDQIEAQQKLVEASRSASELSQLRYEEGIDNYLAVLDARREFYAAQQQLIMQLQAEQAARIQLYRSVGGGRVVTENDNPPASIYGPPAPPKTEPESTPVELMPQGAGLKPL